MSTITVLANGEPVEVDLKTPVSVLIPGQDMGIEVPEAFKIGPEETLNCIRTLEPDQWAAIREHERFVEWWQLMWPAAVPPERILAASKGMQHIAGMILLTLEGRETGKKLWYDMPETYLHPAQQRSLMLLIRAITGQKGP